MQIYQPNNYEVESLEWALHPVRASDAAIQALINGIRDGEEVFTLTIAEAGPNWQHCEFTRERLDAINKSLRDDYRKLNGLWADSYRKAYGRCNS